MMKFHDGRGMPEQNVNFSKVLFIKLEHPLNFHLKNIFKKSL